jgi:hypothetical protein
MAATVVMVLKVVTTNPALRVATVALREIQVAGRVRSALGAPAVLAVLAA